MEKQLFNNATTLPMNVFLNVLNQIGVNSLHMGTDMRTFVQCLRDNHPTTNVGIESFCVQFTKEYDFYPAQQRLKKSNKLLMYQLSINLVTNVPSLWKLENASPTDRLDEVSRVLKTPLMNYEIADMPGMRVTMEDAVSTTEWEQDGKTYCLFRPFQVEDTRGCVWHEQLALTPTPYT